jgi:hypothetical protein
MKTTTTTTTMTMTSSVAESAAYKFTTSSGFSKVNEHLRSVLMSPTSLYLFAALNSANFSPTETKLVQDFFERPLPALTDTQFGNLLINAMDAANNGTSSSSSPSPSKRAKTAGETRITTELEKNLTEVLQELATNEKAEESEESEESGVAALSEWYVQDAQSNSPRQARMDLMVYEKNTDNIIDKKNMRRCYDAYAYTAIGICTEEDEESLLEMWWEKIDQLLNYLNAACVQNHKGAVGGKGKLGGKPRVPFLPKHPVILSVLVLSKSRKTSAIGTFVLECCGTSNKFRMALLSAELCHDIKTTSAAFGQVISLIHVLISLRKGGQQGEQLAKDDWCYLGPDCAKIGKTKVS